MASQRVLPDANVIFSSTARNWIFLLRNSALGQFYDVGYTVDILAEAVARLRDNYPDWTGGQITRLHDKIVENADFRIDDFSAVAPEALTDAGDRHVHAAAMDGDIDILVTDDKGFKRMRDALDLDALDYEVMTADEFFLLVDDSQPAIVLEAVRSQIDYYNRIGDSPQLASKLRGAGCPGFADRVERHLKTLSGVEGVVRRRSSTPYTR